MIAAEPTPRMPSWVQSITAETVATARPTSGTDALRAATIQNRKPPPICTPLAQTSQTERAGSESRAPPAVSVSAVPAFTGPAPVACRRS